jgi:hypothetical protein
MLLCKYNIFYNIIIMVENNKSPKDNEDKLENTQNDDFSV